jgi:hypothetical protein
MTPATGGRTVCALLAAPFDGRLQVDRTAVPTRVNAFGGALVIRAESAPWDGQRERLHVRQAPYHRMLGRLPRNLQRSLQGLLEPKAQLAVLAVGPTAIPGMAAAVEEARTERPHGPARITGTAGCYSDGPKPRLHSVVTA